jgi:hypothetical protein
VANFKVHLLGGVTAGALSAGGTFWLLGRAGLPTAAAALVTATVGGLLPDIDHDHAVPCRELWALLAVLVPAAAVPVALRHHVAPEWTVLIAAAGYALVRFGLSALFMRATAHRGIFHSVPFVLCAGEAAALVFRTIAPLHRLLLGAALVVGAMVHLLLDEAYAVDFTGRRMKKSFGTALKFRAPSLPATAACYLALAALSWLVYRDFARFDLRAGLGR